ncbi:MAG: hypothetical protein KJ558_08105 [Gammaproteobacteria bacterium]|nr:hypothetical protein [Gammaproteobacteria bacterium]MBU1654775.1 hypothetical protein [Gammaproteobacteria bacterium]MBU1960131.1 hypothetical protein [Gammaproteobacteria bacterium]
MTSLFTKFDQTLSNGECRDDDLLSDAAGGGNGTATGASEVITIGADDLFDQAEITQAFQISGDAGHGQVRQKRFQISSSYAPNVELWMLQGAQQIMLGLVEEIEPFDAMAVDFLGRSQLAQASRSCGEVIQSGKEVEIATIRNYGDTLLNTLNY